MIKAEDITEEQLKQIEEIFYSTQGTDERVTLIKAKVFPNVTVTDLRALIRDLRVLHDWQYRKVYSTTTPDFSSIELEEGEQIKQYKDTRYYVSSYGKVYSYGPKGLVRMKPYNKYNYPAVTFHANGNDKRYLIHRLVAELYIPNPDGCTQVDHIDNNKGNARVDNLRWVNGVENMANVLTRQRLSKVSDLEKRNNLFFIVNELLKTYSGYEVIRAVLNAIQE